MQRVSQRPIILLIEDSEDDAFFFRDALRRNGIECELRHAVDGEAALRELQAALASGPDHRRAPDLIFLDLKLPHFSGFDILGWVGGQPFNPPLNIAVLSGSDQPDDARRAAALGARAYFVKPISGEQLRSWIAAWQDGQSASTLPNPVSAGGPSISNA